MNDCLFCKIIAGTIPSETLYEDHHVTCFLDIRPVNEGHALIVPKKHHTDLFDTPDDTLARMIAAAKKIGTALTAAGADGINLGMNNGAPAGQVIFHAHLHVIPRTSNDGLRHWPHKTADAQALKDTAKQIRNHLHD